MTPVQANLMADFWDHIRRLMKSIREHGNRPRPIEIEGLWNFDLEDAYQAIHPMLVCLSKSQLYASVSSLPEMQGSFVAENAHHALSIQFNPPESMFGNPILLESDAIKQLLRQAQAEDAQLAAMQTIPIAIPAVPRIGADVWNDDYAPRWFLPNPSVLLSSDFGPLAAASKTSARRKSSTTRQKRIQSMQGQSRVACSGRSKVSLDDVFSGDALKIHSSLMHFHIKHSGEEVLRPIGTQGEIAELFGGRLANWDQPRVSLAMKELMATVKGFPRKTGMTLYRKLCDTSRICEELKRLDLLSLVPRLKLHDVAGCLERFSSNGREQYR